MLGDVLASEPVRVRGRVGVRVRIKVNVRAIDVMSLHVVTALVSTLKVRIPPRHSQGHLHPSRALALSWVVRAGGIGGCGGG